MTHPARPREGRAGVFLFARHPKAATLAGPPAWSAPARRMRCARKERGPWKDRAATDEDVFILLAAANRGWLRA